MQQWGEGGCGVGGGWEEDDATGRVGEELLREVSRGCPLVQDKVNYVFPFITPYNQ